MSSVSGCGSGVDAAVARPLPDAETALSRRGAGRTAILVTGMHRNGTSALARTLSLLGAALPDALVDANEGNPTGHWEPQGMVDLNDRMLADAGSDLYGIVDIPPDWFSSSTALAFTDEASRLVERSFDAEDLIVLKDPRTALLAPIWNLALEKCGYRVVHVLPLRHPRDVAESLRRRHLKSFPYDAWVEPRGEAVWLRYTLAAVRGSRGHGRVIVHYADLLADWRGVVNRVAGELGLVWPRHVGSVWGEVDAFLHHNDRAAGSHEPVAIPSEGPGRLDLVDLASACFDHLVQNGDDVRTMDAIEAAFAGRIAGVRGLVTMFEGLYPLVWQHYEGGRVMQGQLDAALAAEQELRSTLQRHWAALTEANDERRHLQAELGSRDRQAAGLRGSLAALEERLTRQEADIQRLQNQLARSEQASAALLHDDASAGPDPLLAAAREEVSALRASTSWRVTAPLRAMTRVLRRRS